MCHYPPGANDHLRSVKGRRTGDVPGRGQPPFVVLIDDDEDDSDLLSSSLELLGIRVKVFDSGDRALSYLLRQGTMGKLPSLVILDYNLPGWNGQQVLVLLKSNACTSAIPVVLYSTSISAAVNKAATASGALACLTKPFTMHEFKAQVQLFKDWAYAVAPGKKESRASCSSPVPKAM